MGFNSIPPVVKNLIIINVLVWFAQFMARAQGSDWIDSMFSLHAYHSSAFRPFQLFTYMFLHGDIFHILFNMLVLWMFGSELEEMWGAPRFFIFYMLCGLGAGAMNLGISYIQNAPYAEVIPIIEQRLVPLGMDMETAGAIYGRVMSQTLGASGAIMGCLAAFAYLFPNRLVFLFFFGPIQVKWMVLIYLGIDLVMGIANQKGDNIAHWAHLGGALIGFIIVWTWNRTNRQNFY